MQWTYADAFFLILRPDRLHYGISTKVHTKMSISKLHKNERQSPSGLMMKFTCILERLGRGIFRLAFHQHLVCCYSMLLCQVSRG